MSNQSPSASISALPTSRAASSPAADPNRASVTTWIAVLAAMVGSFMAILNIQITNASLLNIEGGIGTGIDNGSWISTSYLIGEIVVIPLTDYLSRVFSFRRYMLASAALFAAFSVACAFTHDLPSMIAMRGLQGFAGGVLIPMAFTLVLTKLPKPQQPIGLAIFALSVTFAPAIGPTIGGYLTENYGWQTIFFVNVAPTIAMVTALYFTLEKQPMQLKLLKEGDWAGIVTMAIGLSSLQAVLEEGNKDDWFQSPFIVKLAIVGLLLFAASCFMNTTMSLDYAGDQLFLPNVVRALGQALVLTSLTSVSTSDTAPQNAAAASGISNMFRNVGGAIGTASLAT